MSIVKEIAFPHCGDINVVLALLREHGIRACGRTVRNWIRRGIFPAPIELSQRRKVWALEKVRDAILRLVEATEGGGRAQTQE